MVASRAHGFAFVFGRHLIGDGRVLHQVGVECQHCGSVSCFDDRILLLLDGSRLWENSGNRSDYLSIELSTQETRRSLEADELDFCKLHSG